MEAVWYLEADKWHRLPNGDEVLVKEKFNLAIPFSLDGKVDHQIFGAANKLANKEVTVTSAAKTQNLGDMQALFVRKIEPRTENTKKGPPPT